MTQFFIGLTLGIITGTGISFLIAKKVISKASDEMIEEFTDKLKGGDI